MRVYSTRIKQLIKPQIINNMLLKYIRTKQVYNTRIKDNEFPEWVYLTSEEISKFGGNSLLNRNIRQGYILKHPNKPNTYSTYINGDYDLSLLEVPFYKEPLYNSMYEHLLHVDLPELKINSNDLFWFSTFLSFRHILKSIFFKVDDFSGRIHTPITNLKKEYRKNLKFYGENTASLDIATFQPTLLAKVLFDNIGANDFSTYIYQQNDIYLLIQDKLKLETREQAKTEFCTILFGKGNSRLSKLFPNADWIDWINDFKKLEILENPSNKLKPYTNLVWLLQNYEVKLMNKIWNTLVINEIPFITVHDEIIVPESYKLDAYMIMYEVLSNEIPNIKIIIL